MFGYDSIAASKPIGGDRRPRSPYGSFFTSTPVQPQQQAFGGYNYGSYNGGGQSYEDLIANRQAIPAGMKYRSRGALAARLGVNPGGQLRSPAGPMANTRFPMAPGYVGGQQQGGQGDEYEQYAQAAGLRGPLGMSAGAGQSSLMSPAAKRAYVQRAHDNPEGAYQQFSRALGGERQGAYAGVSMNQPPSPLSPRDAFNSQYGQHLQTAMANQQPGMGLLSNEAGAQMGGYQHMPNVTVGGAYGRGPSGDTSGYLNSLLGLNGTGGTVPGGVTDPGTLGALRSRLPAPWMGGGQPQQQSMAAALGFDTTGTDPRTTAARLARASASGGRLNFNGPGRANTGNYNFGFGGQGNDARGNPITQRGIDINAIVKANPMAAYGLTDAHRAELGSDTRQAMADSLLGRQQAYRDRQQYAAMLPALQGLGVADYTPRQQQAMQRGQARQERKRGPDPLMQMFGGDPRMALAAMNQQQQNAMMARQLGITERHGDERNQILKTDAAARLGLTQNRMGQQSQELAYKALATADALEDTNPDLAAQIRQHAQGQLASGMPGLTAPLPGRQGIPTPARAQKSLTARAGESLPKEILDLADQHANPQWAATDDKALQGTRTLVGRLKEMEAQGHITPQNRREIGALLKSKSNKQFTDALAARRGRYGESDPDANYLRDLYGIPKGKITPKERAEYERRRRIEEQPSGPFAWLGLKKPVTLPAFDE
jgi:hypothetical protein